MRELVAPKVSGGGGPKKAVLVPADGERRGWHGAVADGRPHSLQRHWHVMAPNHPPRAHSAVGPRAWPWPGLALAVPCQQGLRARIAGTAIAAATQLCPPRAESAPETTRRPWSRPHKIRASVRAPHCSQAPATKYRHTPGRMWLRSINCSKSVERGGVWGPAQTAGHTGRSAQRHADPLAEQPLQKHPQQSGRNRSATAAALTRICATQPKWHSAL